MRIDRYNKVKKIRGARNASLVLSFLILSISLGLVIFDVNYDFDARYEHMAVWCVLSSVIFATYSTFMLFKGRKFEMQARESFKRSTQDLDENRKIVQALSTNYSVLSFYNLATDELKFLKLNSRILKYMQDEFSQKLTIQEYARLYANKLVHKKYRDEFISVFSPEYLKVRLEETDGFSYVYLAVYDDCEIYFCAKLNWLDKETQTIAVGFYNVDEEERKQRETYGKLQADCERLRLENEALKRSLENK